MTGPWMSGVQVSRTAKGQTPVADLYCAACHTHKRVTGRDKVRDFMRANPLTDHRATCRPANKKGTTRP